MKRILIAAAGLSLLAGAGWADGNKKADDTSANAPAKSSDISGQVKLFDATARSLTVALPSGEEQKLTIANDAKITRDGAEVGLVGVKEGDNVRASFDAKTHEATMLELHSKTTTKY
jgi:hypothetical protein